ncbi:MAG: FGGY family carbohydrate kinase, partial [Tepidisphaeraceae bacterium]
VKAAVVRNARTVSRVASVPYSTRHDHDRVETDPGELLSAVRGAIHRVGAAARRVEAVAPASVCPAWLAMDARGNPITPLITHQDRRAVAQAEALLAELGPKRWLAKSGNLPFPGSISAATIAWFNRRHRATMRRADLIGHVQTWLHRVLTGARVIDPSHASYTGLYSTVDQSGWNEELCALVGATEHQLPQIVEAEGMAGMVTRSGGRRFGLTHGTPVLTGCLSTSAAMLLAGAKPGGVVHLCGSTDLLAVCTDRARPHSQLVTGALGVGRRWVSTSALAAGSAISRARRALCADVSDAAFWKLVDDLSHNRRVAARRATSADHDILRTLLDALAKMSETRLRLLREAGVRIDRRVVAGGSLGRAMGKLMRRDWRGSWRVKSVEHAGLCGLSRLL